MPLIADTLNLWESFGIFSIVLPFILIFAVIYGMLTKMEFFEKRSTNILISASVGLIATALGYYGNCLSAFVIASVISITCVLILYLAVGFVIEEPKKASAFAWIIVVIVFYIVFTTFPTCSFEPIGIPLPIWIIFAVVIGFIVWIFYDKSSKKGDAKKILDSEKSE